MAFRCPRIHRRTCFLILVLSWRVYGAVGCNNDNNCKNGGSCTASTCSCVAGWEGATCTTASVYGTCNDDSHCKNGGTCTSSTCSCVAGWEGATCTTASAAPSVSCNLGCVKGSCVVQPSNTPACKCDVGYGGTLCEHTEKIKKCLRPIGVSAARYVPDHNMNASSSVNEHYSAKYGRLKNPFHSAWCANRSDVKPRLEIHFDEMMLITGVATQGDPNGNNFVSQYKIATRLWQNGTFQEYVSITNTNTNPSYVNQYGPINPPLKASQIQFRVEAHVGEYACMRVEVYGCAVDSPVASCFRTFGLAGRGYGDKYFYAPSSIAGYPPGEGRLNGAAAWCLQDSSGYLRVTLGSRQSEVVGVITQGLKNDTGDCYTQSYRLSKSTSGSTLLTAGSQQTLSGNFDGSTMVAHFLDTPVSLASGNRYLVFFPQTFYGKACLRVEAISCDVREDLCLLSPCKNGGKCTLTSNHYTCTCIYPFTGLECIEAPSNYGSFLAETHTVNRSSDTDSASASTNYRLTQNTPWCANPDDMAPFLEIFFPKLREVISIGIGGHTDTTTNAFVEEFKAYSKVFLEDELVPRPVVVNMVDVLSGTSKTGSDTVYHFLDHRVLANSLRFVFNRYSDAHLKCARIDIKGFINIDICSSQHNPCQNGATCETTLLKPYMCWCIIGFEGRNCETAQRLATCIPVLGVSDKDIIPDSAMSASSVQGGDHAKKGRLKGDKAWCGKNDDAQPYIEVDFEKDTVVFGVSTQGHSDQNRWVKTYKVMLSDTLVGEFTGNNDKSTAVNQLFYSNVYTRKIRIIALTKNDKYCMRIEVFGINHDVISRFLLSTNEISDGSITASSVYNTNRRASNSRLKYTDKAWCVADNDWPDQYLQIKFEQHKQVSVIVTKGAPDYDEWVTAYYFNYTFDAITWETADINGNKVFIGNWNRNVYSVHILHPPILALAVRFIPITYSGHKCLRVDLHACDFDVCKHEMCHNNATCGGDTVYKCVCNDDHEGDGKSCTNKCDKYNCHDKAMCNATTKYKCVCKNGYVGDGISCEVPCEKCHLNSTCNSTATNYTCACNEGFVGNGTFCRDLCKKCHINATCNSTTNYTCVCNEGFVGNGVVCTDPCEKCHLNATCNSTTNYTCVCNEGFVGNGIVCTVPCEKCHLNATCNSTTNYTCACNEGFVGNGTVCRDPCKRCHINATCNSNANYTCACNEGFVGNGTFCRDPCKRCHVNATCNSTTNYTCACNEGFVGNGIVCRDLCEKCHLKATCNSTTNYTCDCNEGFVGNGTFCTDPCEQAKCHQNATCVISGDAATCTCGAGWSGNGTFCTEFHEWGEWSSCSGTCGNVTAQRIRECIDANGPACIAAKKEKKEEEEKACDLPPCPVHGNWSVWQDLGACSVTCGSGFHNRIRNCTNPKPAHGGDDCVGVAKKSDECTPGGFCPGEAGFGEWTKWTECSKTCGDGFQNRTRTCKNAALGCTAKASQGKPCFLVNCPVNGGLTEWGNWSVCSKTCGLGQELRQRDCTKPKPAHGGADCVGPATDTHECTLVSVCPDAFGFGEWSAWKQCNTTCGSGLQSRSRECTVPKPGDTVCQGKTNETQNCDAGPCPVDGGFSNWTRWSVCSHACDYGQREKTRSCTNPPPEHGGSNCSGATRRLRDCIIANCSGVENYTPWSSWSVCSVSCASGIQSKTRFCLNSTGHGCDGPAMDAKECFIPDCPVHGGFTEWESWSICGVTCGFGLVQRKRECTNPEPANNGSDCLGLTLELKGCSMPEVCPDQVGFTTWTPWSECNVTCSFGEQYRTRNCTDVTLETCNGTYENIKPCYPVPCPVHGQYSDWSPWSSCSGYCGSGLSSHTRTCTSPEPAHGGAGCIGAGEEVQDCQHSSVCIGESGYTAWSAWSLCTQTCGNSTQIRTRTCNGSAQPKECSTTSIQTKSCDFGKCPINGGWSDWSSWGVCSLSCGSGGKLRKRTCTNPVPSYGGLPCYGNSDDYNVCVMPLSCPGEEEFSDWGNWDACSTSCGEGTRKRSRYCIVLPTYPPAEEAYCTLPTEQFLECYQEPCVVHGNFTPWTGWSACSTTCGFGTRRRYRNCTNPPPFFGGDDCIGALHEVKECGNHSSCSDDGDFAEWGAWEPCTDDYGGVQNKYRECTVGETKCFSEVNVTMECNTEPHPADGGWSIWTPWSSCSKTCGHQEEVRTRVCDNPSQTNGGAHCSGHSIEVMPCNYYDYIPCPEPPPAAWTDWSWWIACNQSCSGGHRNRYRECTNPAPAPGKDACVGEASHDEECNVHPCAIHGNFTVWTTWSECTLECGDGSQIRARSCSNPSREFGGDDCDGDLIQLRRCNVDPCPIDGGFTEWSDWAFCNKPCNTGVSGRKRSCTNPTPMYGGRNCIGATLESNDCNTHVCSPVNIRLNMSFNGVTFADYNSDQAAFQSDVETLINSAYNAFPPALTIESCSANGVEKTQCTLDLRYASVAEDELVVLQDKLLEQNSKTTLHNMSSDNIISSPLTPQASVVSSTIIEVGWSELVQVSPTAQGLTITGYIIFYKETNSSRYQKVAAPSNLLTATLKDLKKFTPYKIVVSPYSRNGNGVPSSPLQNTTLEDVPSVPPVITDVHSPSSTSLIITWTAVNDQYWHGIRRGYCVSYRASGSSQVETRDIGIAAQLRFTLTDLKPYTRYYLEVAAKTTPGCGAKANANNLTQEDVPGEAPQNVTGRNTSSTSILVEWNNVRVGKQNGIIRGYKVSYTINGVTQTINVTDGSAKQVEITGLDILKEYAITVLAYTSVGDGNQSNAINVFTDESTPSQAPLLVKAVNTSSSSIFLQWQAILPENYGGIFLGYRIYYRPANTKRRNKVIDVDTNTFQHELTNLFLWWWYEIRVAGYTRVGSGVTANVSVQTDEELPSRYPENIRGIALTTTTMSFEWDSVLPGFVHGVLQGYNLTVLQTKNFSNIVVQEILHSYERYFYVGGLKKYTDYSIWVRAINSRGHGAFYGPGHINSTGEDGPEFPPEDIRVSTLEHISILSIEWTRIPQQFWNGILRGYYVEYTAVVLAGQNIPKEDQVVQSVRIRGNRYAAILRDLDPGSTYEVKIFGYTIKNGTKNNGTLAETCRCPKYIRSNWWVHPPYTNLTDPTAPGGIFFMVTNHILDQMCGVCENGHGRTEMCYSESCEKKLRRRRSISNIYQKDSLQGVTSNINRNYEISFPVQGNKFMTTYAGVFPYISVVDAPGSAYFTVKNVPSTAEVVVNAASACIPMVILMSLFAWLAGIVIWILERKTNEEHFPDPFTKGVPEGFWWAFVSMTTVGYGDRSPVTIPGRIFSMIWILMGLIIISIITGGIVTSVSSVLVIQEDKIYGAQVGAISGSSEYSKAVRQNADVVGYKNLEDVINAMNNKDVAGALIDMYAAATKKTLFQGGDIQMNRMIEYPTGYGIVLSGNMAKAAPLFYEALAAKKGEVSQIIEENTETISQDRNEAEEAKEKSSGLFDPTAEAFRSSFNATISLLATAIVAGLIYHFGVYRKREKEKKKKLEALKENIPSLRVTEYLKSEGRDELEGFTKSLQKQIVILQKKHIRERKKTWLYKAEKARRKTAAGNVPFFRRSITRVSPEVNAGMDVDENDAPLYETSPRQSSLSVFSEFKRQRSAQVHPAAQSSLEDNRSDSSAIELQHLSSRELREEP